VYLDPVSVDRKSPFYTRFPRTLISVFHLHVMPVQCRAAVHRNYRFPPPEQFHFDSYGPYRMLPSESSISTVLAPKHSGPCSRPTLPLMITSAFPLPAQSRSVHPMQTSQAGNHQMRHHSPHRRLFVWAFCTTDNIILLGIVPHSPHSPNHRNGAVSTHLRPPLSFCDDDE
jgi:hypothetical protein